MQSMMSMSWFVSLLALFIIIVGRASIKKVGIMEFGSHRPHVFFNILLVKNTSGFFSFLLIGKHFCCVFFFFSFGEFMDK